MEEKKREVWLRGPLPGIPALLQPVAHALLQAREELNTLMENFPGTLLWQRPANLASPAFHLQHLAGVLDRLFTYAKGEQLSSLQLDALRREGKQEDGISAAQLVAAFNRQVDIALDQLKNTKEQSLTETREVGRARIQSTLLGLLVHAAEHTQRHFGQLLVTVRILKQ